MNAYMATVLGSAGAPADAATVNAVRLDYWKRYGATLLGMVRHHDVRADDFLRAAHRFDDLRAMIRAERGLGLLLRRLPGRKVLLTNAPQRYAREVLRHLGLHRHFAHHVAVESMQVHRQLRPKPSKLLLRKLLAKERAAAGRCVLVEDTADNLKAAKAVGLRTVWVTRYLAQRPDLRSGAPSPLPPKLARRPAYVDVKVQSVRQLPARLRCLQ